MSISLDIPVNLTGTDLTTALNDRLRTISLALPPADTGISSDLDMLGFRIVDLGDALNPQDALNMRTADRRYATVASATKTTTTSPTSTSSVVLQAATLEITLSAATTVIPSPIAAPSVGDILIVKLKQDSTGGRKITFSGGPPAYMLVTPDDLDVRPNKVTNLTFACMADGNWWLTGILAGRP